ncbi:peptidase inhibitor family I36 protein [Actinokineospora sp. G85]|uniref:peptidase inhibitor family I36 protein n=1 Tax=Actinokineospora sp. G85 TaxID=3406626 RepID=UPI003C76FB86
MTHRNFRRALAAGFAVVAMSTATAGVATAEQAGGQGAQANTCPALYFCLFYNSNRAGAIATFFNADPDFANDRFAGSGAGAGQVVKNNAASAQNRQTGLIAQVWFNSNYGGPRDDVLPSNWRNLTATYNDNASFNWRR